MNSFYSSPLKKDMKRWPAFLVIATQFCSCTHKKSNIPVLGFADAFKNNGRVLLQAGYFKTSSPEPLPGFLKKLNSKN